jgi:hypothetical protein
MSTRVHLDHRGGFFGAADCTVFHGGSHDGVDS